MHERNYLADLRFEGGGWEEIENPPSTNSWTTKTPSNCNPTSSFPLVLTTPNSPNQTNSFHGPQGGEPRSKGTAVKTPTRTCGDEAGFNALRRSGTLYSLASKRHCILSLCFTEYFGEVHM